MAGMRKIGATIALDGESAFKKSVSACTSSLKTMKSELDLVSKKYEGNANSLEALQEKHDPLAKTLEKSQKVENETAKALSNAQKNYEIAGKQIDKYRQELADAEKQLSILSNSQDASQEAIAEQQKVVDSLNSTLARGEKEYEQAGKNIETWTQKLNQAKSNVIDWTRELEKNDTYLNEAKHSTDGCATSIDKYGKQVKNAEKDIKESTENTTEAVQDLTENVGKFFTADMIVEYADKVSDAFKQVADSAYQACLDIDEGYDTILTKTGATGEALDEFTGLADNIWSDLPVEMKDVGVAIGEVNTRFGITGKTLEDLSRKYIKFANINETDLNSAIDESQAVLTAFGKGAEDAGDYLDVLTVSAQKTGVQIGTLQSSLLSNAGALQDMGMDLYEATDFIAGLEKEGLEASTVLTGLKKAYNTTSQEGKDFRESLVNIQDALQNNTDSTDVAKRAYSLFGKSYQSLVPAIRDGRLDFKKMADSMDLLSEATDATDKTFDSSLDTWDSMQVAMQNLKAVSGEIAGEAFGVVAPMVEDLVDLLKDANKAFKSLPDPVKKTTAVVGLLTAGVGVAAPKVIALKAAIDALKTAKEASKTLKNLNDTIDTMNNVKKTADALNDVADATTNVANTAGKGTGLVSKFGSKLGWFGLAVAGTVTAIKMTADAMKDATEQAREHNTELDAELSRMSALAQNAGQISDNLDNIYSSYKDSVGVLEEKENASEPIVQELEKLQSASTKTSGSMSKMGGLVEKLNSIYPELNASVDKNTGNFKINGREIKDLSDYMSDYSEELKNAARAQAIFDEQTELYKAEAQKKRLKKELEAQIDDANEIAEKEFDGSYFSYAMNKLQDVFNGKGKSTKASEWEAIWDEVRKGKEEYEKLDAQIEEHKGNLDELESEQKKVTEATKQHNASVEKSCEGLTGAGLEADRASEKYVDLFRRIKESGGDIDAVAEQLNEEETELKELFENTSVAWKKSHDTISDGLEEEVASLSQNMGKWQEYKESVTESINTPSEIFAERQEKDAVTWQQMTDNLKANAEEYAIWNQTVSEILSSTRYANDEAFREIANRIMQGGIESSDYLQQFVSNVNLNATTAKDDLKQFAEMTDVQETYAGTMANLNQATTEGMNGIAQAYDSTKTVAQQSLQELSDTMQEQADTYSHFVEYTNNIIESERYRTDEQFRAYANTLMQQGIAGSEQVKALWEGMESGSAEVDEAVKSYSTMREAQSNYADTWASIQTATQDGVEGTVRIVEDAGSAWEIAAANDSTLLANGVDMSEFISKVRNGANTAGVAVANTLSSEETKSDVYDAGVELGEQARAGFEAGFGYSAILKSDIIGESGGHRMKLKENTRGNTRNTNVNMNVYGAQGQSEETIANRVISKIKNMF